MDVIKLHCSDMTMASRNPDLSLI